MYTYEEIKSELLSQITQLLVLEPKWKKCRLCPHSGFCCIGADIILYECEWYKIKTYLLDNPHVFQQVKKNFESHSQCYFRVSDRCLIHDIRPLNCIFTPYQAIYGADKLIHYSSYRDNCRTELLTVKSDGIDLSNLYISLPTNSSYTYYLLMNHWYLNYEVNSSVHNTGQKLSAFLEPFLKAY